MTNWNGWVIPEDFVEISTRQNSRRSKRLKDQPALQFPEF
jgi:hypothetical protein